MANRIKNINGVDVEMTDAEQTAFEADIVAADPSFPVREKRNELLAESDWMANSDVTMSDAWKTYRQALRDLPSVSGFPDVNFPTKPE